MRPSVHALLDAAVPSKLCAVRRGFGISAAVDKTEGSLARIDRGYNDVNNPAFRHERGVRNTGGRPREGPDRAARGKIDNAGGGSAVHGRGAGAPRRVRIDGRVHTASPQAHAPLRHTALWDIDEILRGVDIGLQDFVRGIAGDRYRCIVATGESLSEEFRTSGDVLATWVAHQAVKLGDGVSVTGRDITQRKLVEAQLRNRAENDVLTGLPNRTLFFERLEQALTKARKDRSSVAVLFLDVDHFKQVNDTHGHAAGDAVLIEFAHRLRNSVRVPDIVARLSGDEFAIMVGELDDIGQVEHVAAHIVDTLAAPFELEDKRLSISASIGISYSAQGRESAQSLVGRADRKLYQAKAAGRGRFSSATEANIA